MTMNNLILTPIPLEDLLKQFKEIVEAAINAKQQKDIGEKLISPKEACKIFQPNISRVTLDAWTASEKLIRYDIGGRVYYRYSEIIEAAKTLKRYKK